MKKFILIIGIATSAMLVSCGAGKDPGVAYMPDMYYSVAHETYAPTDKLKEAGANFNGLPVAGTVSKSDDLAFTFDLKKDSAGYAQSAFLKNPLDTAGAVIDFKEAERQYLINCGICHGSKLDGNGPLFNGGNGPYTAAPKNFMDAQMIAMAPGTMFYSVTYGIRAMGSYASQLTPKQRWEIVSYIKAKQKGTVTTKVDSAAIAMK